MGLADPHLLPLSRLLSSGSCLLFCHFRSITTSVLDKQMACFILFGLCHILKCLIRYQLESTFFKKIDISSFSLKIRTLGRPGLCPVARLGCSRFFRGPGCPGATVHPHVGSLTTPRHVPADGSEALVREAASGAGRGNCRGLCYPYKSPLHYWQSC